MKIAVVGAYPMVREGIISIITDQADIKFVGEASTITESLELIKKTKPDIIITDVILDGGNGLELFRDIKSQGKCNKFILMGIYGDADFVMESLEEGVEGYILREANPTEILYAIRRVKKGKKYIATNIIEYIYENRKNEKISILTPRENEVLISLAKGMTNKQIATEFYISEHTVKKHVSQILSKLKLRDRTQAAIYAHHNGLID